MSYTPTVWATGDVVTATKLNKLENGVAAAGIETFIITVSFDNSTARYVFNKTAGEIWTAINSGKICRVNTEEYFGSNMNFDNSLITAYYVSGDGTHRFYIDNMEHHSFEFACLASNEYPYHYAGIIA